MNTSTGSTKLTTNNFSASQKGFSPILIILGIILVVGIAGGVYYFGIRNNKLEKKQSIITSMNKSQLSQSSVQSSPTKTQAVLPVNPYAGSFEEAFADPSKYVYINVCKQNLSGIPSNINLLINLGAADFSLNNLTTIPDTIVQLKNLKELNLIYNNISLTEQTRIQALLPNTKIAFYPQKDTSYFVDNTWKSYTNTQDSYAFKYPTGLTVSQNANEKVRISNDFAILTTGWDSCASQEFYINFDINIDANSKDKTPIQYLESLWNKQIIQNGDQYTIIDNPKFYSYGPINNYSNGNIKGIIVNTHENEGDSYEVIFKQNDKIYLFNIHPGGQTGTGVTGFAKNLADQILSTFEFTE